MWWIFGAQDRALASAYRDAIKDAAGRIAKNILDLGQTGYNKSLHYVGNPKFSPGLASKAFNPFEWRSDGISITRLAAFFPLIVLLLWLCAGLLLPMPDALADKSYANTIRYVLGIILVVINIYLIGLGIVRSTKDKRL